MHTLQLLLGLAGAQLEQTGKSYFAHHTLTPAGLPALAAPEIAVAVHFQGSIS